MAEHPESRPPRAVGDTTYSYISGATRAEVTGFSRGRRSDQTSLRHELALVAGIIIVLVAGAWLLAADDLVRVLAAVLIVGGVALSAIGILGYRRERRAIADVVRRIEREQRGPVE